MRWYYGGVLFVALNIADTALTALGIDRGGGLVREANPAMAFLIATLGLQGFALVKPAIGLVLAIEMVRRRSSTLWIGIALLSAVCLWNAYRLWWF